MVVGVVKETFPGERRVGLVPAVIPAILKTGAEVLVDAGAGVEAGFPDEQYREKGARIARDRGEVFAAADVVCMVRTYGANPGGAGDLELYRQDQTIIGLSEPLTELAPIERLAQTGVRTFALELVPRITRAQAMDVLSSQATIGGYKAVALAVDTLPKLFPMMMTAAGTIAPAKVFVVGAGVAGLQAIASAKRAGAVVYAIDVRPEVKEQVESLGGKFVELPVKAAEGEGGYAREQTAEERAQQQQLMADTVAECDVVITTAAVPGKRAPRLITAEVVRRMRPGTLIVDMAAERGGNCELTKPDEVVNENGVMILGPTNMPASIPQDASRMFAKNVANLLGLIIKEGVLTLDRADEVITGTMLTEHGDIVHAFAREVFELPPLEHAASE
ncbi:MAG: NAD(P) transhydrogenase subunit alpha [Phycisphaerales bacterium]|nr:NAD(P) transhydrogenase subunit alpha [Phycisphaerales bacterium]